jgi:acyl transferase domain-containing protein
MRIFFYFFFSSLGEYSALASVADVLSLENLIDVVFYRGMTMQSAVVRDAQGHSNYGMCAGSFSFFTFVILQFVFLF